MYLCTCIIIIYIRDGTRAYKLKVYIVISEALYGRTFSREAQICLHLSSVMGAIENGLMPMRLKNGTRVSI